MNLLELNTSGRLYVEKYGDTSPGREPKPYKLSKAQVLSGTAGDTAEGYYPGFTELVQRLEVYVHTYNRHLRRLHGKMEDVPQLVESIVEFAPMVQDLSHRLFLWQKYYSAKRLDLALDFKEKPTHLAENWLLYNFGLAPLIGDINKILERFQKGRRSFRIRVSTVSPLPSAYFSRQAGFFVGGEVRFTTIVEVTLSCELDKLIRDFLGLSKPYSTLWELTPWSWAIDYFANVQELLSNFDSMPFSMDYKVVSHSTLIKGRLESWDTGWVRLVGEKDISTIKYYTQFEKAEVRSISKGIAILTKGLTRPTIVDLTSFIRDVNIPKLPGFKPETRLKPYSSITSLANLSSAIYLTIRGKQVYH